MKRIWQGILSLIITVGLVATAWATVTTYQYNDAASNAFNIQLFECINTPVYCTAMILEDSSGNEKFTSGNPGTITGAVTNAGTFAVQDATVEGAITSSVMQSNTKQVNGTTTLVGAGAVGSGSQRVAVGEDTNTIAGSAPGTAGSASANVVTVQGVSSMTPVLVTQSAPADPCFSSAKTNLAIDTNSTSSVQLIALSGSTTIYVCSLSIIAAGATTVAFTTGTGTACASSNAAVIGSATSGIANSISLAANGGLTLGSGVGTIAKGASSSEFCIILGSSAYVAGNLTYVQQ